MKFFYLLVAPLVSARVIGTQQQIPILEHEEKESVRSVVQEAVPAVGVHFTTSYAIAAARYQNGTIRDLVKVAGDAQYIDLMSRWTVWDRSTHTTSQNCHHSQSSPKASRTITQRFRCNALALERSSRRLLGLSSSQDVAVLSAFMKNVRDAIEIELDAQVTNITPAFPRLSLDVKEDVREAMSLAGLTSTRTNLEQGNELVYGEANAAYAGLGHGLCAAWKDKGCGKSAKEQTVLYFNFDNYSFSLGAMSLQNAFQDRETYHYGMDTTLGWWNLPVFEVPRAEFWARINEMILDVLEPMSRPPNRIVLLGEHGADAEFKEVVEAAVWEKFEFDVELMLQAVKQEDAGKLAARGAAELGWQSGVSSRADEQLHRGGEEAVEL